MSWLTAEFERVRDMTIEWATLWGGGPDGDRLAFDSLPVTACLRVEAFNLLLPLALAAAGLRADFRTGRVAAAAKRRGLDRALRAAGLRLTALGSGRRPVRRQAEVTAVSEMATPSTLEPSFAVARVLGAERIVPAVADPRSYVAWRRIGFDPHPLLVDAGEARRLLASAGAHLREAWATFTREPYRFELDGRDATADCLAALRPLVLRSAPWLAVERLALERALDRYSPRWVLLASDQHRIGRLAVVVARGRARSLVLQHGLPGTEIGYVPVAADRVAVWSEDSERWFVEHGADPERLVRLGNPRLDRIVGVDRKAGGDAAARRYRLDDRPRVLVVLSPTDDQRNLALVDLALNWLRGAQGSLIVKLHPGEGRWEAIRSRLEESPLRERLRIVRHDPLHPLLAWAEVTLLHHSSVALESLAAGTPVAVADVGGRSIADVELRELRLPRVTDQSELNRLVARLSRPAEQQRYLAERRDAVERATGPLDGRAAERIAAFLLDDSVLSRSAP